LEELMQRLGVAAGIEAESRQSEPGSVIFRLGLDDLPEAAQLRSRADEAIEPGQLALALYRTAGRQVSLRELIRHVLSARIGARRRLELADGQVVLLEVAVDEPAPVVCLRGLIPEGGGTVELAQGLARIVRALDRLGIGQAEERGGVG